jgi:hypothetical protein
LNDQNFEADCATHIYKEFCWFGLISCGIFSLPIHIPQCQKKWLAEEQRKPKKERRPLPPPPAAEQPIKTTGAQMVDDFNTE